MSSAEASTAGKVVRCCKCNAVVSVAGSRKSRRRMRRHSSQRCLPVLRPKVLYDLHPPYAVLGGLSEYRTDYMQFGNYPEDEMAFITSSKRGQSKSGLPRSNSEPPRSASDKSIRTFSNHSPSRSSRSTSYGCSSCYSRSSGSTGSSSTAYTSTYGS